MPELPEVETVRAGLAPVMTGRVLQTVAVNRPNLRFPFPERMAERLTSASSPRWMAEAITPITPIPNPMPKKNIRLKNEVAMTSAASGSTPYQPTSTVSLT